MHVPLNTFLCHISMIDKIEKEQNLNERDDTQA